MPRYHFPSEADTVPESTRSRWLPVWLLAGSLPLLMLTPIGRDLLLLGVLVVCCLFLMLAQPLVLVVMLLLLGRWRKPPRRVAPPRPAPYWTWQPWEIGLGIVAFGAACLYYGVVDGWQWVAWRWRRATRKPREQKNILRRP